MLTNTVQIPSDEKKHQRELTLSQCASPFAPEGKHWPCLQSLSHTSGPSLLDGPKGAQGQSEDEAETVSAMASLSVDVEQQASALNNSETSRSAALCDPFAPLLRPYM